MVAKAFVGTSGWQYKSWKDEFYQGRPQREWLEFAASRFTSLEADGTFYRLQKKETFESWAGQTPPDFRFAIRGHRYSTHNKKLLDPEATIEKQAQQASGFGDKLAVVLWQLPAAFHKNIDRLRRFIEALRSTWPAPRHAVEFRDKGWFDAEVSALLSEFGLANVISDAGGWPRWDAVTTDFVYVRLHGVPDTYASDYEPEALEAWACRAEAWLREGRDVYVFFDNDARGHAPFNALDLLDRLGRGPKKEVR